MMSRLMAIIVVLCSVLVWWHIVRVPLLSAITFLISVSQDVEVVLSISVVGLIPSICVSASSIHICVSSIVSSIVSHGVARRVITVPRAASLIGMGSVVSASLIWMASITVAVSKVVSAVAAGDVAVLLIGLQSWEVVIGIPVIA